MNIDGGARYRRTKREAIDGPKYAHARSMAARMRLVAYYADDLVCTCRLAHIAEIQHGIPFRRDLGDHHAGIGPK
jgi:hypothetical protein